MADAVLFDPLRRRIVLHDRTWFGHVLKGHPEVAGIRLFAESAISNPIEIRYSASDPDCRIYYGKCPVGGLMVAVIADVKAGFVKTAYMARKVSPGGKEW